MKNFIKFVILILVIDGCSTAEKNEKKLTLTQEIENQLSYLVEQTINDSLVPRTYTEEEGYRLVKYRDWTSGFPAGSYWYMYELTGDDKWKVIAETNTEKLEKVQSLTTTHDLGFMSYCSYGNGYRITKNKEYKQVLINSANSLITRFDPNIGCIKSWDWSKTWQYPVIIDNMMNLELLLWASEATGNPKYKDIAIAHANTTLKNHFRDDMSSYHVVSYDTTTYEVEIKQTHQGLNDESAWGRGQAWGLYGYTVMYRETGDVKYLEAAQKIADFILVNLPEDKVSYWDFNDPKIPDTYRDVSAAAIEASAFFDLGSFDIPEKDKYAEVADQIVESLSSDIYRAGYGENGGFILMHSVGNLPEIRKLTFRLTMLIITIWKHY